MDGLFSLFVLNGSRSHLMMMTIAMMMMMMTLRVSTLLAIASTKGRMEPLRQTLGMRYINHVFFFDFMYSLFRFHVHCMRSECVGTKQPSKKK